MNPKRSCCLLIVGMVLLLSFQWTCKAQSSDSTVEVDLSNIIGKMNYNLIGAEMHGNVLSDELCINYMRDMHLKTVRILALYKGLHPDVGTYNFTELDRRLVGAKETGASIILCLGHTMPEWLADPKYVAKGCPPSTCPPSDYKLYEELIYQIVKHCKDIDVNITYYEVWNEPDIVGEPDMAELKMLFRKRFFTGGFADYAKLYDASARAVLRGDPGAKVGGPATALPDHYVLLLLLHCAKNDVPMDFVSWHLYPNIEDIHIPVSILIRLESWLVREYIALAKLINPSINPELILDEWGYDYRRHVPKQDTNYNAAFASVMLNELSDISLDKACYFWVQNGYNEERDTNEWQGDWGMITILNDTVKPVYNAFKMWSMLGEYVVSTQCDDPRLGVIASIGRDRITILLWNFNTYESRAKEKVVDLKIRGIKFENDFFMRRYLIDATHSNGLYSKYKQWPECVENKKIRRTEDLTLEINMEPYSVSLIVLSPVEKKSVAPIVQVDCPEVVSDSITLKIKATDDGFITLVEYRIDNEEWDRIDNKEKDTYRIRLDASTIQEGNYQISVRVFDNEGNETNIKKEIAVGPTPPGINLVFVFVLLAILIIILIAVLLKRKKGAKK